MLLDNQDIGAEITMPKYARIRHIIDCTARQVKELRQPVEYFAEGLQCRHAAMRGQ